MRLAVVGSLAIDRVDGGAPRVGGCPFYAARALRVLGTRALVVAKCAAADRETLLPPLTRFGLPVLWRGSRETAAFSIAYNGDRRRMTMEAVADPWTPAEVGLPGVRWVHAAPLAGGDFPVETLAALARGRVVSLDGQGLVRPKSVGPLEPETDFDPDILRHVSILKLAEDEAELLVDGLDERALRQLGVPEVVVTLGSLGCIVYADGVAELVRARRVDVPDPTGAGDGFSAAYLAARSAGAAPAAAGRRACAVVADLLSGRGR